MRTALMEMANNQLDEVKSVNEAKSSTGYELYHRDFSSAMQHAYKHAKAKLGVDVDPEEIDKKVAMGPSKPSKGKTNSYRLLDKDGKKAIQVQVYGMDNGKYELNMYKESVDYGSRMTDAQKKKFHDLKKKMTGGPEYQKIMRKNQSPVKSDDEFHNLVLKKVMSEERAAWVPESITDEQVEAFMEATVAAIAEGEDTFVFEGKHYKAKTKKEDKLDPVGQEDDDIDNDGDVDSSDKYLKKRRSAIKKRMAMDEKKIDEISRDKQDASYTDRYATGGKDTADMQKRRKAAIQKAADRFKKTGSYTGKKESVEEAAGTAQHGPDDATSDTFQKQMGGGRSPREKEFVDMHKVEVALDVNKIHDDNKNNIEAALKQTPPRLGDQKTGDTSFVNPVKADIIDGITKALQ